MTLNIVKKWLTPNEWSRPQDKLKSVKGIVVHWWASPLGKVEGVWNFYENRKYGYLDKNGDGKEDGTFGSAHFIIGLDGYILQCIPENEMAYGAGGKKYYTNRLGSYPNNCTLHIEMAHTDWNGNMTRETWDSSVKLVAHLLKKYNLGIDDIYRHYDITHKDCPKLFVNHPEKFEEFKQDVYKEIMKEKVVIAMSKYFKDVPANHWSAQVIDNMKEKGLVAGKTDGTFGLGENIKREEAVVMISRAIDYVLKELK